MGFMTRYGLLENSPQLRYAAFPVEELQDLLPPASTEDTVVESENNGDSNT